MCYSSIQPINYTVGPVWKTDFRHSKLSVPISPHTYRHGRLLGHRQGTHELAHLRVREQTLFEPAVLGELDRSPAKLLDRRVEPWHEVGIDGRDEVVGEAQAEPALLHALLAVLLRVRREEVARAVYARAHVRALEQRRELALHAALCACTCTFASVSL